MVGPLDPLGGAKVGPSNVACGPLAPCHIHLPPMCFGMKFVHVWSFPSSVCGLVLDCVELGHLVQGLLEPHVIQCEEQGIPWAPG